MDGHGVASESPTQIDGLEHERRFILTRGQAQGFLRASEPHRSADGRQALRRTSVRTTYFDTDDLRYLRSCDGPVSRRLRIREYALAVDAIQTPRMTGLCFLELKETRGSARTKVRLAAPLSVLAQMIDDPRNVEAHWPDGGSQIEALRALGAELASGHVAARVATWYRRLVILDRDHVRVTLDQGLTYHRPTFLGAAGQPVTPSDVLARGPGYVLELKYTGALPAWLIEAASTLTEDASFSKFRFGMEALQGRPASLQNQSRLAAGSHAAL